MKHVLKPVHDSDKREKKVFSQVDFETGKLTLGLGIMYLSYPQGYVIIANKFWLTK